MTSILKDWRSLPTGKAKYQAYLASREWALLREQVRARSGGWCERCCGSAAEQVHHQTYERIYAERLDDLVHLCRPCHEFVSGKRHDDPLHSVPVFWHSRAIRRVYLAGKITGTPWRDGIIEGGRKGCTGARYATADCYDDIDEWPVIESCLPIPDGRLLDYSGPFWRDVCYGGHGPFGSLYSHSADGPHAYVDTCHGAIDWGKCNDLSLVIHRSILNSDALFAWIDSTDCFGTILEIGLAIGCRMPVIIASRRGLDVGDIWLTLSAARTSLFGLTMHADTPRDGWDRHWSHISKFKRTDRPPSPSFVSGIS